MLLPESPIARRREILDWIGLPEAADALCTVSIPTDAIAEVYALLIADRAPRPDADPIMVALAAIDAVPAMVAMHHQRGLSADISRATAGDLALWMREHHRRHGVWGLSEGGWLRHHLSGRLLRLGRLQFMLAACDLDGLATDDPVRSGDPVLDTHIPAGEPLTEAACLASFAQSASIFASEPWIGWTCHSWLLGPRLHDVLPASSNILAFRGLFRPLSSPMDDRQAIERIFGSWPLDPAAAPRETSLQRAVLAFYAAGGRLDGGSGFRPRVDGAG